MGELSVQEERDSYITRHRLTVEEFHRMGETGVFPPGARIELFEGELIDMVPIGPAHANTVDHLVTLLAPLVGSLILRVQNPLRLGSGSELISDLMLLRRHPGGYPTAAPGPEDVLLLIEVSDSTIRYDRNDKVKLYSQNGVVETWLLDLNEHRLEIYLKPGPDGYQEIRHPPSQELVAASLIPGFTVAVKSLFAT